jgi:hypothetical protein
MRQQPLEGRSCSNSDTGVATSLSLIAQRTVRYRKTSMKNPLLVFKHASYSTEFRHELLATDQTIESEVEWEILTPSWGNCSNRSHNIGYLGKGIQPKLTAR